MADFNAHIYHGVRALEALPEKMRDYCLGNRNIFIQALYGPDPLIFNPVTSTVAKKVHTTWREALLPALSRRLREGDEDGRSFAAGYLLHLFLDDAVHGLIYGWELKGMPHYRLELALDALILEEQGCVESPRLPVKGGRRTAKAGADFFLRATETDYMVGLRAMAAVTDCVNLVEDRMLRHLSGEEQERTLQLRETLEGAVTAGAELLRRILAPVFGEGLSEGAVKREMGGSSTKREAQKPLQNGI